MTEIHLILDNIRSTYNVGSLLRSAEGLGISCVHTIGITPHMKILNDDRLPHIIRRAEREITKTALGAERLLSEHFFSHEDALVFMQAKKLLILSVELSNDAEILRDFVPPAADVALIVGHEREGVSKVLLEASEHTLYIPMLGEKHSLNVSIAGAIAMYELHEKFATIE